MKKAPADVLAALPPAESYAKAKFPTVDEQKAAKEVIAKQWDAIVGATLAK
jgi:putative spermidine/putrescine transport system substrate-binding protein